MRVMRMIIKSHLGLSDSVSPSLSFFSYHNEISLPTAIVLADLNDRSAPLSKAILLSSLPHCLEWRYWRKLCALILLFVSEGEKREEWGGMGQCFGMGPLPLPPSEPSLTAKWAWEGSHGAQARRQEQSHMH